MNLASIKINVVNVVAMGRVAWVVMVFHFQGLSKINADCASAMAQTALATRAGRGLMERHARCVSQASTRARLDLPNAAAARRTRARLRRVQLWPTAPARLAGRGLMEVHV